MVQKGPTQLYPTRLSLERSNIICKLEKMRNQIKGFLETSFIDWPGKIVSVLFLPHCNFRCPYCHNYGLVLNPEQYQTISVGYILHRMSTLTGWVDGICITGGEPTLFPSLAELIGIFKARYVTIVYEWGIEP